MGIARTRPGSEDEEPRRDVEALHVASLRAAQRWIYLENQYPTAHSVGAVLAEPEGPELVIVSTRSCEGWLEEQTMGVLRARWLGRLRDADRHGRLRVLHPVVPDLEADRFTVHAKIGIVDDLLLRIGSANPANRSMGLDSECDLAIEARDAATAEAIEATLDEWVDEIVPDGAIFDPERPVSADELHHQLLQDASEPKRLRRARRHRHRGRSRDRAANRTPAPHRRRDADATLLTSGDACCAQPILPGEVPIEQVIDVGAAGGIARWPPHPLGAPPVCYRGSRC